MLRLIPALFLVITVSLLVYGLFIKTFDGYHDDRHVQPPTVLPHLPSVSYNTFGTYSNTYQTSADINQLSMDSVQRVRSSSSLPPIIETEIPEDSTDESVSKKSSPVLEPIPEFAAVGVANSASALTAMEDVQVDVDACAQEDVRTAELIGEPSQHVHDPSVTVAGLRGIVEKGNDGGKEGAEHV